MDDLLGGLLGGGVARRERAAAACRTSSAVCSAVAARPAARSAGGMNVGALAAALGPLIAKFLQGGGLSKIMQGAQANGLCAQADSWVGTGENQPLGAAGGRRPSSATTPSASSRSRPGSPRTRRPHVLAAGRARRSSTG